MPGNIVDKCGFLEAKDHHQLVTSMIMGILYHGSVILELMDETINSSLIIQPQGHGQMYSVLEKSRHLVKMQPLRVSRIMYGCMEDGQ